MAAIGLVSLKYLDQDNRYRRELAAAYDGALAGCASVRNVPMARDCEPSRHLYQILVHNRDGLMAHLNSQAIYPGVHYRDNTAYPMYRDAAGTCPKAKRASDELISLPLHLNMGRSDAERVAHAIRALTDRDPRCRLLTVEHLDDSLPRPDGHRRAVQRINDAIKVLAGEIVHYLADDDLFDVNRFEIFDELFSNPDVVVGYGRLDYVDAAGHPTGETRYFERVDDPMNVLDQNQVAHRRLVFDRIPAWFEVDHYASDGEFFRAMSRVWSFCGIDRVVGYKRLHGLNMQATKDQSTGSANETILGRLTGQ